MTFKRFNPFDTNIGVVKGTLNKTKINTFTYCNIDVVIYDS